VARCFAEPTPSARARRPDVPPHVDATISRALAKFPTERFRSAEEFAASLTSPNPVPAPVPARSVAVLPFESLGGERGEQYLGDGIAEEIISHLAKLKGIRVAARTSSFAHRGPDVDARAIGMTLGVETVLAGRVRRAGSQLRVSVELTGTADGLLLWAEHYDREMRDVFAIQDDIAQAVVTTLEGHLAVERHERAVRRYTESVDAFELYLRGRYAGRTRRHAALLEGIALFERSIAADPNYALAYASLADSYTLLAWYRFMPPREAFPRANVAAVRALECDELLPQAHASAGVVRFYYDWDWSGAERALLRALDLKGDEPTALHVYGEYLIARGRLPEAREHAQRALAAEPGSVNINAGLGWIHYFMRDYELAADRFSRTRDLEPNYVFLNLFLGQAYLAAGHVGQAVETLRGGVESSGGHPGMLAYLGHALGRKGLEDDARRVLAVLRGRAATEYVPADYFAVVHLGLGERDEALAWLERARRERALHLVFLDVDPMFDGLRADPRFQDILRSIGLT
jgi:TolB-like protein